MGVNLGTLIKGKEISLDTLRGRTIGIDAFNHVYQYLTTIRDWKTGELLKDSSGNVTSHLSGLFYRTSKLLQVGIKICYVWDGLPPKFKKQTQENRSRIKEEARKKYADALKKGDIDKIKLYAQQTATLSEPMIQESIELLETMGIPSIRAPSEGEAQLAYMAKKKIIWTPSSQDFDTILFGSPRLVRNITISGRKKLPYGGGYTFVYPEIIELNSVLNEAKLTIEQLILIALFCGTDYNPGIKGIGPKKAYDIVTMKSQKEIFDEYKFDEKIFNWFLKPDVKDVELKFKDLNEDKIHKILVDKHEFSSDRVNKSLKDIKESREKGSQSDLSNFF